MLYQIDMQSVNLRFFTEPRSFIKIPYYTVKEMRNRYPDRNFAVIGEIGGIARASGKCDKICVEEGKELPILPRGSLKRPFEWVIGYAGVQGNRYVAVIGGIFHLFMAVKCVIKSLGNRIQK